MNDKLLKSASIVSIMTFLSRILGFLRDIIIARLFGASMAADLFFVAFKIPNFLRRLFAEGAFSQAFVPVLVEYRNDKEKSVADLISATSGTLAVILFIITAIGVMIAPFIMMLFAPGFIDQPEKMALASELLRITFPYLFFISLTALAGAILNSFGQFAVPAFTPVLLNLSLIIAAVYLAPLYEQPVFALAWGVFIAGLAQLLFQLPFLARIKQLHRPRYAPNNVGVKQVTTLMIPALFGVSVSQINLLLDTILASFLETGSISWLYYSDRLVEFPLAIFGIALATVILPSLSQQQGTANHHQVSATLDWAIKWTWLLATPAAIGLVFLAEPLLVTLFQYGAFQYHDAQQASYSLIAYAFGLLPFIFIKVLATAYYARQDTKTPVKYGIIAMVVNMVLNIILMMQFAHIGLAMATSLSAVVNALLLYIGLRKRGIYQPLPGRLIFIGQLFIANLGLVIVLWLVTPSSLEWQIATAWSRIVQITTIILIAIVSYIALLRLLGIRLETLIKPETISSD